VRARRRGAHHEHPARGVPPAIGRHRRRARAREVRGTRAAQESARRTLGARLVGRTANQYFLYGNGFWVIERNGRRGIPRGIRVVPAEDVQFVWLAANTDTILSYDWRDLQGHTHAHEPVENVMHFRDLDATDGLFGYPRLAAALLDISADSEASSTCGRS
jgi:hypothetical protein